MSGVSHTNTVLILSDLGLLSPSAHSWLCLKVPRQSWGRWAASGAPPNPGAAPPGVIPLSSPARIDFQQDKGEGRERGVLVFLWLLRGCSCPWGPSSCPSLGARCGTVRPARVGFWGGFGLFCRISAAGSCRHLCGGLPGGGTAETDASQGKSREQRSGMQSSGHRAWDGGTAVLAASHGCPELPSLLPGRKTRQFLMARDKDRAQQGQRLWRGFSSPIWV